MLQSVQGYHLELVRQPIQKVPPPELHLSEIAQQHIEAEVEKLIQKQAVLAVTAMPNQFVSSIFAVPKKDGSQRPVVNLKPLNTFVKKIHFKMEGVHMIKELLRKDDWMVSIDLKDTYLSVPVTPIHRKYLRFNWRGQIYEFQCLPFGLSSAPRTFTKVLRPVMAILRQRGMRSIIFIDDILLIAQSPQELLDQTREVTQLLQLPGFRINWEKSVLTPCQEITYLGFLINSKLMMIYLPEKKRQAIIEDCRTALSQELVSVRTLARIIGRMTAAAQAIAIAPLHYRKLQYAKNSAF